MGCASGLFVYNSLKSSYATAASLAITPMNDMRFAAMRSVFFSKTK